MAIRKLVQKKGGAVITIDSRSSVEDAVDRMASERVSALIVTERERPVGIFSGRDLLRTYLRDKQTAFDRVPLSEAMTNRLVSVAPEDSIDTAIDLMLQTGIRHLPVIDNDAVAALLTIDELVRHRLDSLHEELQHLKDYISDLHEAGRD